MSGHSMYCNTEENKRCDCYLSHRQPVAKTWFETGKAHYETGMICDERYPLEYVKGYADAASIVGITTVPRCYMRGYTDYLAYWGESIFIGTSEANAIAGLINHMMRLNDQCETLAAS